MTPATYMCVHEKPVVRCRVLLSDLCANEKKRIWIEMDGATTWRGTSEKVRWLKLLKTSSFETVVNRRCHLSTGTGHRLATIDGIRPSGVPSERDYLILKQTLYFCPTCSALLYHYYASQSIRLIILNVSKIWVVRHCLRPYSYIWVGHMIFVWQKY